MNPECLILIARLCLPPSVQSIEIANSPVGSEAVVQLEAASLRFTIWSDSLNPNNVGLTEYCERSSCVHFSAKDLPGPGIGREYHFRLNGEGAERMLIFRASNPQSFKAGIAQIRILSGIGEDRTMVPLSALTIPRR